MQLKKNTYNKYQILNILKSKNLILLCNNILRDSKHFKLLKKNTVNSNNLYLICSKTLRTSIQNTIFKYIYNISTGNIITLKFTENILKIPLKYKLFIKLNNKIYLPYQLVNIKTYDYSSNFNFFTHFLLKNNKYISLKINKIPNRNNMI